MLSGTQICLSNMWTYGAGSGMMGVASGQNFEAHSPNDLYHQVKVFSLLDIDLLICFLMCVNSLQGTIFILACSLIVNQAWQNRYVRNTALVLIPKMHRAEPHYLNTGCQFLIPFYPAISTLTLLQTTFSMNSWGGFSSALDNNLCSLLFSYGLTQKHKCPRKGFTVPEQCWIPCRSGCITFSLSLPYILSPGLCHAAPLVIQNTSG